MRRTSRSSIDGPFRSAHTARHRSGVVDLTARRSWPMRSSAPLSMPGGPATTPSAPTETSMVPMIVLFVSAVRVRRAKLSPMVAAWVQVDSHRVSRAGQDVGAVVVEGPGHGEILLRQSSPSCRPRRPARPARTRTGKTQEMVVPGAREGARRSGQRTAPPPRASSVRAVSVSF